MVPQDDHELIRTCILRLRQGERQVHTKHYIYAKSADGRPSVEFVEIAMHIKPEEECLVFVVSNVTSMLLESAQISKEANEPLSNQSDADQHRGALLNASPLLGLGATLHELQELHSELHGDETNAEQLFDDFFDDSEGQHEVVSIAPMPGAQDFDSTFQALRDDCEPVKESAKDAPFADSVAADSTCSTFTLNTNQLAFSAVTEITTVAGDSIEDVLASGNAADAANGDVPNVNDIVGSMPDQVTDHDPVKRQKIE